ARGTTCTNDGASIAPSLLDQNRSVDAAKPRPCANTAAVSPLARHCCTRSRQTASVVDPDDAFMLRNMRQATSSWKNAGPCSAYAQTQAMRPAMPPRTVTLCADETWLARTMILVANEPVSGWLWVQKIAATRDQATWTAAVQEGTRGMALTIHTVGADCGTGIVAMAVHGLGVTHSAEVFHGQYELTKAYSRRLAARVQAAETAHAKALTAPSGAPGTDRPEPSPDGAPAAPALVATLSLVPPR